MSEAGHFEKRHSRLCSWDLSTYPLLAEVPILYTSSGKYKPNTLITYYNFQLATIIFKGTSFILFCCYQSADTLRWEGINLLA